MGITVQPVDNFLTAGNIATMAPITIYRGYITGTVPGLPVTIDFTFSNASLFTNIVWETEYDGHNPNAGTGSTLSLNFATASNTLRNHFGIADPAPNIITVHAQRYGRTWGGRVHLYVTDNPLHTP